VLDWTHLEWADAKYWPTDVVVTDPSRMNMPKIDKLLIFWRQRQETLPASEIFHWSHVHVGPRKDPRWVPAMYPNVNIRAVDQENGGTETSGKVKGKKKQGKGKGKQKVKASPEIVGNSDQEGDGPGGMRDLPAVQEHTEPGPSLITAPQPEAQWSPVRDIDAHLRPDEYSNWLSIPQNGYPEVLQHGAGGDSMVIDEYRVSHRPADGMSMRPVRFWEHGVDSQQDLMLKPYGLAPHDIPIDVPQDHSFPTHTHEAWTTAVDPQHTLTVEQYGRADTTTLVETASSYSTPTNNPAAGPSQETDFDTQQTTMVITYDGPPNRILHQEKGVSSWRNLGCSGCL